MLTVFTILSQLIGFGISVVSAGLFGTGSEIEAYIVSQTIPTYVSLVVIGGLGYSLIPVFIEKQKENDQLAWDIASPVVSIYLLVILICMGLGLIFTDFTLSIFFSEVPEETLELAIQLSYVVWPSVLLTALITMIGFIYNAYERYIYHAFTQLVYSLSYFLLIYFGNCEFGIYTLAIGVLLSSILQLVLLLRFVIKKFSFKIIFNEEIIRLVKLQVPVMIAAIFGQFPRIMDRTIASKLAIGSVAYITYADKMKGLIGVVIGSGLAITFFPVLIKNLVDKNETEFGKNISLGMKISMLFLAPVVCFGSFFAMPLVSLLFERGAFKGADSTAVASILPFFLISLIGGTLGNVSSRAIYALKKTKIIAITDVGSTILYIIYAPILGDLLGLVGLGIAMVILWNSSFLVQSLFLWFNLNKPNVLHFLKSISLVFFIAFISSFASYSIYAMYLSHDIFSLLVILLFGMLVYSLLLYVFKIEIFFKFLPLIEKVIQEINCFK